MNDKSVVWCIGKGQKYMSGYQGTWCNKPGKVIQFDCVDQAIHSKGEHKNTILCVDCVTVIITKLTKLN